MPFTVRISDPRLKFSASHFLYQHDKCSRLHGHNYSVNVELTGKLDEHFFVVDFYEIKSSLNDIISGLDHAVLLPAKSEFIHIQEIKTPVDQADEIEVHFNGKRYVFPKIDVRLLPIPATTAELLAEYIFKLLKKQFFNYKLQVEVAESEGSIAIYNE
ncbi:MAG: 6-pyruvoyl tetrahydropterin synthase family protein [Candidatus Lokiarchaeota archaeon]|nr:6-pyruvoyl tetrahydropterin synthase family protein [Candidatus Harpocratesius repetitus]